MGALAIRMTALAGEAAKQNHHRAVQDRGDSTPRPWRGLEPVEFATLEWVDWFNNRRILEPIGNLPPAEVEAAYYRQTELTALAA